MKKKLDICLEVILSSFQLKEFADREGISFRALQNVGKTVENVGGKFGEFAFAILDKALFYIKNDYQRGVCSI